MTPLVKEVTVAAPVDRAWDVFTNGIDGWWPAETHSIDPGRVRTIELEARVAGRIVERWDDDTECSWGEVDVCDPPHRLRFSWHPYLDRPEATEIEVTFTEVEGGTRVRLEHRGWERLGGHRAESRGQYDGGWDFVLGRYATAVT